MCINGGKRGSHAVVQLCCPGIRQFEEKMNLMFNLHLILFCDQRPKLYTILAFICIKVAFITYLPYNKNLVSLALSASLVLNTKASKFGLEHQSYKILY